MYGMVNIVDNTGISSTNDALQCLYTTSSTFLINMYFTQGTDYRLLINDCHILVCAKLPYL